MIDEARRKLKTTGSYIMTELIKATQPANRETIDKIRKSGKEGTKKSGTKKSQDIEAPLQEFVKKPYQVEFLDFASNG